MRAAPISHRGLDFDSPEVYPENSLPSFEHALRAGFGIEVDQRRTRDYAMVVVHDPALSRTTVTGSGTVGERTVEELKRLELKNAVTAYGIPRESTARLTPDQLRIPTFREVCALFRTHRQGKEGMILAVHQKDQGCIERIVRTLEETGVAADAVIFDISIDDARRMKAMGTSAKTCLTVSDEKRYEYYYSLPELLQPGVRGLVDSFWWDDWLDRPESEGGILRSPEPLRRARDVGPVYLISPELHTEHGHPHAATFEEVWKRVLGWPEDARPDAFCTDHPSELRAFSDARDG